MHPQPVNLLPDKSPFYKKMVIICLVVGLFLFGVVIWNASRVAANNPSVTLHPKSGGIIDTVTRFFFDSDNVLEGQTNDRINILLLGIGGAGHDGPYLSDTNIILSIRPSTKDVAMISIPRDLGVKVADQGVRKINYADAYGEMLNPGKGGDFARQVFSETFKQPIPYYIRVDFKAFSEIVDAVGGIDVAVPRTFTDTQFPGPDFSYRTVHFDAGVNHLDGETALTFARSRHGNNGEGSDFARAHRQQLVLETLKHKLLSAGTYTSPATISQILSSLTSHITTNLDAGQLLYLGTFAKDIKEPIHHLVLDNSPSGYLISATGESGAFLLFPKTGDYTTINTSIDHIFETTSTIETVAAGTPIAAPAITPPATLPSLVSDAKVEVQNGTWRVGLAARVKGRLAEQGMRVIGVGNSLKRPIDKTAIYVLNLNVSPATTKALSAYFKAPVLTVLPDWLQQSYDNPSTTEEETGMKYNKDADVLIILGTDNQE